MSAFYFGDSDKSLFGFYHTPQSQQVRDTSVVFCNPIGHEYNRTYRAIRNLAIQLSKQGFNVLRFNYYATGDSSGGSDEATIEQWVSDINLACSEIKDISGERNISIIGLRFGAYLALQAAKRIRFQNILLWEPVLDGKNYLRQLEQMHLSMLTDSNRFYLSGNSISETSEEFLGHPYSLEFQEQMKVASLENYKGKKPKQFHLVCSDSIDKLKKELDARVNIVTSHKSQESTEWDNFQNIESMFIANKTISNIVNIIGE